MDQVNALKYENIKITGIKLFAACAVFYMLLTSVVSLEGNDSLKLLVNASAMAIITIMGLYVALVDRVRSLPSDMNIPFLGYYFGMIGCAIIYAVSQDISVLIKLFIGPIYLAVGYSLAVNFASVRAIPRILIFSIIALMVVPLIFVLMDFFKGYDISSTLKLGIFANRNNAALYMICVIAISNCFLLNPKFSVIGALLVSLLFGTLGVFFAVIVAISFVIVNRRNIRIISLYIIFSFAIFWALPDTFLGERLGVARESLIALYAVGMDGLAQLTYGDMVRITGSSDLSLFFRLKHWDEIIYIWGGGGMVEVIFGWGAGAAAQMTTEGLVPHNDYLRYFFEFGLISFVSFIVLQYLIINKIGRNFRAVPFLVISIYMLSENLVDNYLAMMLYYFSAGMTIYQMKINPLVERNLRVFSEKNTSTGVPIRCK